MCFCCTEKYFDAMFIQIINFSFVSFHFHSTFSLFDMLIKKNFYHIYKFFSPEIGWYVYSALIYNTTFSFYEKCLFHTIRSGDFGLERLTQRKGIIDINNDVKYGMEISNK